MTESLSTLDSIAISIDEASDRADTEELQRAMATLGALDKSTYAPVERAAIEYYLANARAGLRRADAPGTTWDWSQLHLE